MLGQFGFGPTAQCSVWESPGRLLIQSAGDFPVHGAGQCTGHSGYHNAQTSLKCSLVHLLSLPPPVACAQQQCCTTQSSAVCGTWPSPGCVTWSQHSGAILAMYWTRPMCTAMYCTLPMHWTRPKQCAGQCQGSVLDTAPCRVRETAAT